MSTINNQISLVIKALYTLVYEDAVSNHVLDEIGDISQSLFKDDNVIDYVSQYEAFTCKKVDSENVEFAIITPITSGVVIRVNVDRYGIFKGARVTPENKKVEITNDDQNETFSEDVVITFNRIDGEILFITNRGNTELGDRVKKLPKYCGLNAEGDRVIDSFKSVKEMIEQCCGNTDIKSNSPLFRIYPWRRTGKGEDKMVRMDRRLPAYVDPEVFIKCVGYEDIISTVLEKKISFCIGDQVNFLVDLGGVKASPDFFTNSGIITSESSNEQTDVVLEDVAEEISPIEALLEADSWSLEELAIYLPSGRSIAHELALKGVELNELPKECLMLCDSLGATVLDYLEWFKLKQLDDISMCRDALGINQSHTFLNRHLSRWEPGQTLRNIKF